MVKAVRRRKLLTIALDISIKVLGSYHLKVLHATFKQGIPVAGSRLGKKSDMTRLYREKCGSVS
jgi:hypothetical protein